MLIIKVEYLSVAEIKKIEDEAIRKGMTEEKMMDTAGHLIADFIHKNIEFKKAVFVAGTGNNGGDTLSVVDLINNNSNAKKISVDIPSGMNGDTGEFKKAVKSDFTLTMLAMKKAFRNPNALTITGKIFVMHLLD